MVMSGITFTVLVQIATSLFNKRANKKSVEDKRNYLQQIKLEAQEYSRERIMEKFRRFCDTEIQMEEEDHKERLRIIAEGLDAFVELSARQQTLKQYKLNISPYIIRNKTLLTTNIEPDVERNVFCLLTNSNNESVNALIPLIDYSVSTFVSANWGMDGFRHISYYDNTWNRSQDFEEEDVTNIKSLFRTIPFLLFSPILEKSASKVELVLRTRFWGINSFDLQTKTVIFSSTKRSFQGFTSEESEVVVNKITNTIISQIGLLTDIYFWHFFHEVPVFPKILIDNLHFLGEELKNQVKEQYSNLYKILFNGIDKGNKARKEMLEETDYSFISDITEFDNMIFPERRLKFLNSIKVFYDEEYTSDLAKKCFFEFCHERGIATNPENIEEVITSNEDLFSKEAISFYNEFLKLYSPHIEKYKMNNHMNTRDAVITPTFYSKKRDELISLIDDTLKVPGLSEQVIKDLKATKKKCLENQYNIVLVAQYQTGKSTTLNALCGGREISPRGAMSKTSACKIEVKNLADSKAEEYAIVHWKTDKEILLNVKEIIERKIKIEDLGLTPNNLSVCENITLGNEKHRMLVKKVLINEYNKLKLSFNVEDSEKKEIIRIAILSITYYSHEIIRRFVKQDKYSIDEIGNLCVFPDSINKIEDIKPEEAVFSYVSSIECFIHSQHLARLGCTFTDCPGLFASAWDTKVTYDSLPDANAILYILSGEKQAGKQDVDANLSFKRMHLNSKIFFAINAQKPSKITQNILQKDKELINQEDIYVFNAQLFFLANIGKLYLDNRIDDYTIKRFNDLASYTSFGGSFQDYWINSVKTIGESILNSKLRNISELNDNSIDIVLNESNYHDVFDPIEQFIVKDKAHSILIDKGINKLIKELSIVEDLLIKKEQDIFKDVANCEKEYLNALSAYSSFEKEVNQLLQDSFSASIRETIVSDGYDKIARDINVLKRLSMNMAISVSDIIRKDHKKDALQIKSAIKRAKKKNVNIEELDDLSPKEKEALKSIKDDISPVVKRIVDEEIKASVTTWANSIFSGENEKYKEYVIPEIEKLASKIRREWKRTLEEDSSLKAFSTNPPSDSVNSFKDELPNYGDAIGTVRLNEQSYEESVSIAQKAIIEKIIIAITAAFIYTVIVFIFPIIGFIIGVILLFSPFFEKDNDDEEGELTPDGLDKPIKTIYFEIFNQLVALFDDPKTEKKIKESLNGVPDLVFKMFRDYYKNELSENRKALELNIEERRREREKSNADREMNVQKYKKIRESIITPLFKKYERYINNFYSESI